MGLGAGPRLRARTRESAAPPSSKTVRSLYGDQPDRWEESLQGEERLRFIVNCLTRLRYVDTEGRLALRAKGSPKKAQTQPSSPGSRRATRAGAVHAIVFGHWSTLGFFRNADVTGLDTGCVWGDRLTALRLDVPDAKPVQVGVRGGSRAVGSPKRVLDSITSQCCGRLAISRRERRNGCRSPDTARR